MSLPPELWQSKGSPLTCIQTRNAWASYKQKHTLYLPILIPFPHLCPSWDCKPNKTSAVVAYVLNVPFLVIGCHMKSRLSANAWWAELSLVPYYFTDHYLNCYLRLKRLFWDTTESIRIIYTPLILHNSYFELTWRMDMHNEFACSKAFHYEKNTISAIKKAREKGLSRFLGMDFFFLLNQRVHRKYASLWKSSLLIRLFIFQRLVLIIWVLSKIFKGICLHD